jgi:hypothetical protein
MVGRSATVHLAVAGAAGHAARNGAQARAPDNHAEHNFSRGESMQWTHVQALEAVRRAQSLLRATDRATLSNEHGAFCRNDLELEFHVEVRSARLTVVRIELMLGARSVVPGVGFNNGILPGAL